MTTHHTIADCLATLEIAMETLEGCESLQFEFAVIKKAYFKVRCLIEMSLYTLLNPLFCFVRLL